ncbi:precorrin-2 dehydrogenase/sirohydrochlorin ferrochelatase family protein [Alkalitalea saponilacus]|uniref:precorrin-2 dehydrogenase n=1 Tax=Alkalitalea saponilacus TaxID=889453 RepID=A0A1T5HHX7_9BACT|nr:bifunctional precorrin-2 dehydrogenase/sirohydrochlorin ferrochelatase [Alkalitalea saponilacus]ASB48155.1 porphyrin biosynthesis protein [Alkalitalea saponilacus]SKC20285.1 precorrin-2 dehydrogenase / sirohydrochlorin ferrochelatase [Alkalitalea saponilacus]
MTYLPININLTDAEILIIGGGNVALHKVEGLERFTQNIRVVSPELHPGLLKREWIKWEEKIYDSEDLKGAFLVFAATNHRQVNEQVRNDAQKHRCLVNVVDAPSTGDFISPAIFSEGDMTVAVSSGGKNVHAAVKWRNDIRDLAEKGLIKWIPENKDKEKTL